LIPTFSPSSLEEALQNLSDHPESRPIAGCTDLFVCEPEDRLERWPGALNLSNVPELRKIGSQNGVLEIGATVTFTELQRSDLVKQHLPALATAASEIGGKQIQNRATLGGNIANASPAGDSLPVLLALEAEIVAVSKDGERTIRYDEFHTGYRQIALEPGELIGRVRIPFPEPETQQFFWKVGTREAQAISKVVVAIVGRVDDGKLAHYCLAAGSVAATPIRLEEVEKAVLGRPADEATAELAGNIASESVDPIDDVRSTAAYRKFALQRVVRRLTLRLSHAG
jgi:xanthine dehydrogenase small subunit